MCVKEHGGEFFRPPYPDSCNMCRCMDDGSTDCTKIDCNTYVDSVNNQSNHSPTLTLPSTNAWTQTAASTLNWDAMNANV